MLRDIDPFLEVVRIEKELRSTMRLPENARITIDSPRMGKSRWFCLATVPKHAAQRLLQQKAVQVGNTKCKPEEWITLPTCFNGLKPGHLSRNCPSDKSDSKRCFKCGDTKHLSAKAKELTAIAAAPPDIRRPRPLALNLRKFYRIADA